MLSCTNTIAMFVFRKVIGEGLWFIDDGPLKITIYQVTWLPSRNKAFSITTTAKLYYIFCILYNLHKF